MKKTTIALTLTLALACAAPAMANPFSDVPADHWSYDAITKLAADGVITGNPDGTFTGKKNMTRYEMAMVVAKAMAATEANADKVSAQDKATLEKLAGEYGTELKGIGVRVSSLENKIGGVKIGGEARARYIADNKAVDTFDGRVRLNVTGAIDDNFKAGVRVTTGDYNFKDYSNNGVNATFDRLYVSYDGKLADVTAGRQEAFLGQGTLMDGTINGVSGKVNLGNYSVTAMGGKALHSADKIDLTAAQLDGVKLFDKVNLGAAYAKFDNTVDATKSKDAFAVYGNYTLNNKVNFFGEYAQTDADNDNKAYTVGSAFKGMLPNTDVAVSYAKAEKNATTGFQTQDFVTDKNTEIVKVEVDHALSKSANFYADYSNIKDTDTKVKSDKVETGVEIKF